MALPQVGLQATFLIREFRRNAQVYNQSLKDVTGQTKKAAGTIKNASKDIVKSFDDLAKGSHVFQEMFDSFRKDPQVFIDFSEKVRAAFAELPKGAEVSISAFDRLLDKTGDIDKAMEGAVIGGGKLATTLSTIATVAGVATTALAATFAVVRRGVQTYSELADEMNRLALIMGTTSSETAAWAKIARDAGADVSVMQRSVSYLERQLTDLTLRQIEGKETSTQFSRALNALGISWQDAEGGMRGADAVMTDIISRTQELGPSSEAAAHAAALFGRSNRDILPILFQTTRSIEEQEELTRKYGLAVTELNRKLSLELAVSMSDLNDATRGFWATIGKDLTPDLISLVKVATELVVALKNAYIALSALSTFGRELSRTLNVGAAFEAANEKARDLLGIQTELEKEAEDLAKAERLAAINAVYQAEALAQLEEQIRKTQMELAELNEEYNERELAIQDDFNRRWAEMMEDRRRDNIERDLRESWERQDLWQRYQEKLLDIASKYTNRFRALEDKRTEKVNEWVKAAHKKREDLEQKHQERLWKIQTRYQDTVEEAARKNDAVAVVRAIRDRRRALRDANRQRQTETRDLEKDLAERRQKIFDDYEQRKAELRRQQTEEEEAARIAYDRSVAELEKKLDRDRQIRQMHYRWEEEDLYASRQRQMNELLTWYNKERQALEQHLAEMGATATTGITAAGSQIAAATSQAINAISAAAEAALWSNRHSRGVYGQQGGGSDWYNNRGTDPYHVDWARSPFRRAEGGLDVVSKPTAFLAGEAGPEALLSMPLSGAVNVNHQFSRLPVDVGGIPSGMDTSSVETILWNAMSGIAEQLLAQHGG